MLSSVVNSRSHRRLPLLDDCPSSRDEKPLTATPLFSALTNCDAPNPFRIRSYENCRVSPTPVFCFSPKLCKLFDANNLLLLLVALLSRHDRHTTRPFQGNRSFVHPIVSLCDNGCTSTVLELRPRVR